MDKHKNGIKQAVALAGSQTALARLLHVKPQTVQVWVSKQRVPVKRALQIEVVLNGKVTRSDLCPELFS